MCKSSQPAPSIEHSCRRTSISCIHTLRSCYSVYPETFHYIKPCLHLILARHGFPFCQHPVIHHFRTHGFFISDTRLPRCAGHLYRAMYHLSSLADQRSSSNLLLAFSCMNSWARPCWHSSPAATLTTAHFKAIAS